MSSRRALVSPSLPNRFSPYGTGVPIPDPYSHGDFNSEYKRMKTLIVREQYQRLMDETLEQEMRQREMEKEEQRKIIDKLQQRLDRLEEENRKLLEEKNKPSLIQGKVDVRKPIDIHPERVEDLMEATKNALRDDE